MSTSKKSEMSAKEDLAIYRRNVFIGIAGMSVGLFILLTGVLTYPKNGSLVFALTGVYIVVVVASMMTVSYRKYGPRR